MQQRGITVAVLAVAALCAMLTVTGGMNTRVQAVSHGGTRQKQQQRQQPLEGRTLKADGGSCSCGSGSGPDWHGGAQRFYDIEARIERYPLTGNNLDQFYCPNCRNQYPFAGAAAGEDFHVALRTFVGLPETSSPFCSVMGGYDGSQGMLGPCLQANPGDTVAIRITNKFAETPYDYAREWSKPSKAEWYQMTAMAPGTSPEDMRNEGPDGNITENNPGWHTSYDTTNLHLHGLEVEPHLFHPVGTSDPNAPMIHIVPTDSDEPAPASNCYCYKLGIAESQDVGSFIYHIHAHGSAGQQLWAGMLGFFQVGDKDSQGSLDAQLAQEYGVTRDEVFAIWGPSVKFNGTAPGGSFVSNATVNDDGSEPLNPGETELVENTYLNNRKISISPYLVNGVYQPELAPMAAGEVARLRVVCGFGVRFCGFSIVESGVVPPESYDATKQLPFWGVASDGHPFDKPFERRYLMLSPGQREDILVSFPKAGKYDIRSDGVGMFSTPMPCPDTVTATIVVTDGAAQPSLLRGTISGPSASVPDIASWTFSAPTFVPIKDDEIVARRTIIFGSERADQMVMPYPRFTVDGKTYRESRVDVQPVSGTAEEWTVVAIGTHNVHLHVEPVEFMSITVGPDATLPPYQTGAVVSQSVLFPSHRVRDVITIPGGMTAAFRVRWNAKDPRTGDFFKGKTVYHCHLVNSHEETGMMQNVIL